MANSAATTARIQTFMKGLSLGRRNGESPTITKKGPHLALRGMPSEALFTASRLATARGGKNEAPYLGATVRESRHVWGASAAAFFWGAGAAARVAVGRGGENEAPGR